MKWAACAARDAALMQLQLAPPVMGGEIDQPATSHQSARSLQLAPPVMGGEIASLDMGETDELLLQLAPPVMGGEIRRQKAVVRRP